MKKQTGKPKRKSKRGQALPPARGSAHSLPEGHFALVIDLQQHRPACVLLQACYGCGDNNGLLQRLFDSRTWLVGPTEGMRKVAATREQWERYAQKVNAQNGEVSRAVGANNENNTI